MIGIGIGIPGSSLSAGGWSPLSQLMHTWQSPATITCYLWRSYDSTDAAWEMWGPSDNAGHYTCAQFRAYPPSILTIGRLREGIVGTTVLHSAGAVTKTGAWANSANSNIIGGTASRSDTAGDTIACSVTGSTLGLRIVCITNAGYATVAIDGDYTAATGLPVVTQALIDAGKFSAGQIGHRYFSGYASTAARDLWDMHITLAEGLVSATRSITVRVQGTSAGAGGNRVYVAAFVGATGAQVPGDAGTAMFYVRDVTGASTDVVSSMTLAWTCYPSVGATGAQDTGDNHGNETLVSSVWAVDGAPVTPTLDQIISGDEITLTRVITLTHSEVGNIAEKTDVFSCRGDRAWQLQYDWSVTWTVATDIGYAYAGMLTHSWSYLPAGNQFRAAVADTVGVFDLTGDSSQDGRDQSAVLGFLDPSHDTVGAVAVLDPSTSLNAWTYAGTLLAWINDGAADQKAYFTRAGGYDAPTTEHASAAQVMAGSCSWRVFRISDAYARCSAAPT